MKSTERTWVLDKIGRRGVFLLIIGTLMDVPALLAITVPAESVPDVAGWLFIALIVKLAGIVHILISRVV